MIESPNITENNTSPNWGLHRFRDGVIYHCYKNIHGFWTAIGPITAITKDYKPEVIETEEEAPEITPIEDFVQHIVNTGQVRLESAIRSITEKKLRKQRSDKGNKRMSKIKETASKAAKGLKAKAGKTAKAVKTTAGKTATKKAKADKKS